MATLLPENLSIITGHPRSSKDREPRIRSKGSQSSTSNNTQTYGGDPIPEFDEYGKELDKEARVWKIYVKESDRWDRELVDGWNRSLDVILVFAALFSAISTAFLIESSRGLKKDPAETAAQVLLDISQTLKAMNNNSEQPAPTEPFSANSTLFAPSFSDLLVNGLWFMSLSLSVATSFLAMLAKEWCHSFMAGRTGHPYQQSRRRQQRWLMVEKWKMKELMMALPSFIHLALLLFAVGLCLYVWELNSIVTIPMFCVIGLGFGFYAWSSIMAILVDYFPYTTIISRFLQSDWLKQLSSRICLTCTRGLSRILHHVFEKAYFKFGWFIGLHFRLCSWRQRLERWGESKAQLLSTWILQGTNEDVPIQDEVTSQCLSWMVNNCEVPYAIDAALQAISGASGTLQDYRAPLDQCNAALKISRRLVSSNLWEDINKRRISLYIRALSFLGSKTQITPNGRPGNGTGELEVLIWSLQAEYESKVAKLITDGKFVPSEENLDALRIGSVVATYTLQLLSDDEKEQEIAAHFQTISLLIHNHYRGACPLHPASVQSLLNSIELLSACTSHCDIFIDLFPMLLPTTELNQTTLPGKTLVGVSLIHNFMAWRASGSNTTKSSSPRFRAAETILKLGKTRSKDTETKLLHAWSKLLAVLHNPWDFLDSDSLTLEFETMRQHAINRMWQIIPTSPNHLGPPERNSVRVYLEDLAQTYNSNYSGTPISQIYYFVVESRCRDSESGDETWRLYAELLSSFHFPKLSAELLDSLEQRNIIPLLETSFKSSNQNSIRFLAATQLWLLFVLLSDPSGLPDDKARLRIQLKRYSAWTTSNKDTEKMRRWVGSRLKHMLVGLAHQRIRSNLDIYVDRILECMLQAGDYPDPHSEWQQVLVGLDRRGVPSILRGLPSFTQMPVLYNPPSETQHGAGEEERMEPEIDHVKEPWEYVPGAFDL